MSQPGGVNYPGVQSPFGQVAPVVVAPVLKPFVYCEFRVENREDYGVDVQLCPTLACAEIHGMKFCMAHGREVEIALAGGVS